MGGGTFSSSSFSSYSSYHGRSYDSHTHRVSGQTFDSRHLKEILNPKGKIRECCNTDEHPNTVPVILALDVTGSMGEACKETAAALGQIMIPLYEKFKDIEVCIMGVGDFECDDAPLQVSQFESDVRVAQQLDEVWMEHGGGGNNYESYTAPWYFGLYNTKLDCYDKQGRKGVIITMGDEPLNPDLPVNRLKEYLGIKELGKTKTTTLYAEASKKFDIYHIAVDSDDNCYENNADDIEKTFRPILGDHLKTSTINKLKDTIIDCITESIENRDAPKEEVKEKLNENGEIVW